jgi:hypothetical protein
LKPFDVFICHKKSSGKDFAEHLKAGLEELGYSALNTKAECNCEMCSQPIKGQSYVELIDEKQHNFDCKDCALTYRKLKSVYGDEFQ